MLTGWRYRGGIGAWVSGFAGWLGGLIPALLPADRPLSFFLLAGTESAARNRAAIILYFIFQAVALVVYWFGDLITLKTFWIALPMLPTIMLGTWIGEKMFGKASKNCTGALPCYYFSPSAFRHCCYRDAAMIPNGISAWNSPPSSSLS